MHNFIAKDTIRNCITKDIVMNDNDNTIALMQQVLVDRTKPVKYRCGYIKIPVQISASRPCSDENRTLCHPMVWYGTYTFTFFH